MIVWLASYPKSGNTFLRSLIAAYLLTNDGKFQLNDLDKISQFPDKNIFKKLGFDAFSDEEMVKNYIKVQKKINLPDAKSIKFPESINNSPLIFEADCPLTDLWSAFDTID